MATNEGQQCEASCGGHLKGGRKCNNFFLLIRLSFQACMRLSVAFIFVGLMLAASRTECLELKPRQADQIQALKGTDASSSGGGRPPRGYCTHISRAIPAHSRCFDHLIRDRFYGAPTNALERAAPSAAQEPTGGPSQRHAALRGARDNGKAAHKRSSEGYTTERADSGGLRLEELVYVRLETTGTSIQDLNTRAINELLVEGVFKQLLAVEQPQGSPNATAALGEGDGDLNDIRAQILSPTLGMATNELDASNSASSNALAADKCRLSIERLLCRMSYPSCHFRLADVSALVRPPCREDCLLLRDVLCSNLNWPKFARVLIRAFNTTLMSAINELDLEVQGDPVLSRGGKPTSAWPPGDHDQPSLKTASPQTPESLLERAANSTPTASVSSSIHFYWPHENSLHRCESLPPLRSIHQKDHSRRGAAFRHLRSIDEAAAAIGQVSNVGQQRQALFGRGGGGGGNDFGGHQQSWHLKEHHGYHLKYPICSDSYLTETFDEAPISSRSNSMINSTSESHNSSPVVFEMAKAADCLNSKDGSDYRGPRNYTKSGLGCQFWKDQYPHRHTSSELLFDNMKLALNYCRNPGGIEQRPWCYTQDIKIRWEYCDIGLCK